MLNQLTIIAPGLLGGSIAQAVRARGLAGRIVLWARRPEARIRLRKQPWCDATPENVSEAVKESDLTVICAPVEAIPALVDEVSRHAPEAGVVTDVGSVKGDICRRTGKRRPGRPAFVGSHPMAGSEKSGWEHGDPDLFKGRPCFVTPLDHTDPGAAEKVAAFWDALEMEVVTLHPDRHDEVVAHISHLPHVAASVLCALLSERDPGWKNYSGPGLRDTTRVASGDPAMWREILEQNRDEILRALRAYGDQIHAFQTALANRDYLALRSILERGKAYRDKFRP